MQHGAIIIPLTVVNTLLLVQNTKNLDQLDESNHFRRGCRVCDDVSESLGDRIHVTTKRLQVLLLNDVSRTTQPNDNGLQQ
jgi:hypothetical protein